MELYRNGKGDQVIYIHTEGAVFVEGSYTELKERAEVSGEPKQIMVKGDQVIYIHAEGAVFA